MKVFSIRENATCESKDGLFSFNGVAGAEFQNSRRITPLLAPTRTLEIKTNAIYKICTGIAFRFDNRPQAPGAALQFPHPGLISDIRPVMAYFKLGVVVLRVDLEKHPNDLTEIIVYISSSEAFSLKPTERMFESFSLGQAGAPEVLASPLLIKQEGFVPVATRQVTDSSARKGPSDTTAAKAAEKSDEEKRRLMDAFLNDDNDKPGQSVAGGAFVPPPSLGVSAPPQLPGTEAKNKGGGGVSAAKEAQ